VSSCVVVNRDQFYRLVGESMCEAGILVLVFGPLDELIQPTRADLAAIVSFILTGLLFAILGMILESLD